MRIKILSCLTTLLVIALNVSAQPSPIIVGKWKGDKPGSPWVRVNVTREKKAEFGGTAVFFILDRTKAQKPS